VAKILAARKEPREGEGRRGESAPPHNGPDPPVWGYSSD